MKLTRETTLGQLPLHKCAFYEDDDGNVVTLFMDEGDYVVGHFNEAGYLTKGERFGRRRDAWRHFVTSIKTEIGIEVQIP